VALPPPLPPRLVPTLRALLDRLIPPDEFPGAVSAGVENYLQRQLAGDCAAEAEFITLGLAQLDAEVTARGSGPSFATLAPEHQDALLIDLEAGRPKTRWPQSVAPAVFFLRMVDLAHEGFYADPANGGNRDAISWRMVGYDPRMPEPPAPKSHAPKPRRP
jgi:hypothetical protein